MLGITGCCFITASDSKMSISLQILQIYINLITYICPLLSLSSVRLYLCVAYTCVHFLSYRPRSGDVCVVDHVLEVYSFDSIALHMDGLNQIPQTQ